MIRVKIEVETKSGVASVRLDAEDYNPAGMPGVNTARLVELAIAGMGEGLVRQVAALHGDNRDPLDIALRPLTRPKV